MLDIPKGCNVRFFVKWGLDRVECIDPRAGIYEEGWWKNRIKMYLDGEFTDAHKVSGRRGSFFSYLCGKGVCVEGDKFDKQIVRYIKPFHEYLNELGGPDIS